MAKQSQIEGGKAEPAGCNGDVVPSDLECIANLLFVFIGVILVSYLLSFLKNIL
jgi:hypothetical protein